MSGHLSESMLFIQLTMIFLGIITVTKLIFAAINFRKFVSMCIIEAIYFRGLQNKPIPLKKKMAMTSSILQSRVNKYRVNKYTYFNNTHICAGKCVLNC